MPPRDRAQSNEPPSAREPPGGMRMAELAARSGVSRETIHFYLREGLLPRPRKGGKTVAYYDVEHLERLRLIRRLREEKYLPLAVIRRLVETPGATAEGDLDALSEILHIVPAPAPEAAPTRVPSSSAAREAASHGLLGPPRDGSSVRDDSLDAPERRVLTIVEEVLALDGRARDLTMADLEVCATDLAGLVATEAALFFDSVLTSGDVPGSIASLRSGRGAVARFITAYRDLMLRRIVEELLVAIQGGPEVVGRVRNVALSAELERALGTHERRAALRTAAERSREPADVAAYVWHLFACDAAADLAAIADEHGERAGARAAVLVAWGAYEHDRTPARLRVFERAVERASDFALAHILLGEAMLVRRVRRRETSQGFLDVAVPALHAIVTSDPEADIEPVARAFGYFHRGRVEIALPKVLGRRARGADALGRALALVLDDATAASIEPAARARIAANARLLLGRYYAEIGDPGRARGLLEEARATDAKGPIAEVVREELARAG